jgi:hypothetical protein
MLRPKRSFWYEWAYPRPGVTPSAPITFPAPSINDIKLRLQSCPSVVRNIKAIFRIRPQNLCGASSSHVQIQHLVRTISVRGSAFPHWPDSSTRCINVVARCSPVRECGNVLDCWGRESWIVIDNKNGPRSAAWQFGSRKTKHRYQGLGSWGRGRRPCLQHVQLEGPNTDISKTWDTHWQASLI